MLPRTIFLCRLLGLWVLVIAISVIFHRSAMVMIAEDFSHFPALQYISGVFTTLAGLAMVLTHNVWIGGAAPVVVTVVGWSLLIKGVALTFISPSAAASVLAATGFAQHTYAYGTILLFLGLYLTYAGFVANQTKRHS